MESSNLKQKIGFNILRLSMLVILLILGVILYDIISKGIGVINWQFITAAPKNGMTEGGIWPAIVGTFYVTVITAVVAVPLGVFAAIYLNEYARQGKITRLIRMAIRNLAGVPSIVYGLFGLALFVNVLGFGTSILSAGLTLGLMTLPVTITASEEALKAVPNSYRHGSLALGVSKWHSIRTNVLPYAIPGILTGTILGLARAAGETAPILFTGAAFFLPFLPQSLSSQFMALPYHLYIMSTQHHDIAKVRPLAYGTALVLIVLVLSMNLIAILLRSWLRKKNK
ncbi:MULTISPECIES: phosphate ABC transporter permease PstA [unclassified Candidatus Frackibacter]|uniref:phosphate ABC transporter permease PstA n=1 Tax=unclassified Candidatus Frackibacter TaxID=2648818 RepID=UPI0007918641|nr:MULTISPECIES: phosphate ABC transporter permease PstA [unclassified Candidatus Frackibacter]KXS45087.1 MAG: phosphate transport system permease protein [Candidatus Frackibacter sp. T328-2]SDB96583.1 phosphate ABC transporter membrane protein 2, PhoT family [Candidatus Frackibacter sp. WG11]SEM28057.1 phosphate ABC transporter membrane protein 2, PhoT family [Candidatus Frackibacter sp. WG12]SFL32911.1 phosphate ABC transporter membrane protein 2, PhoT family [Candidatus Frackibacter sp. WG13